MNDLLKKQSFSLIFYKFKESVFYSISILLLLFITGILLLIYAVLPQIQGVFTLNQEIKASRDRVVILKNNLNFINSLSESNLEEDLQLTFTALPTDKDFVGIVTAVNNTAARSGVQLDNYSLAIGELATPSAGLEAFFPLSVNVIVHGDQETISGFLNNLQEALPLSEISMIETDMQEAKIEIIFFFKVYKNENYSVATPIAPISSADLRSLRTIREWEPETDDSEGTDLVSSVSGELTSPF